MAATQTIWPKEVAVAGTLPLQDLKVVDLTRALAGPYCTLMLGDLGADVIKIEQPGKGDETRGWGPPFINGESVYFMSVNRNKRSLTLNLKQPDAQEILRTLIRQADVVVENFSPGTFARLGFPYSTIQQLNPRIIYCAISGFGQTGPGADRPAYDLILQGLGGLMSITGPIGGPPYKVGVPIADILAGMFAAYAVMTALYHREKTGKGQMIDTSLLDGQIGILTIQAGRYFATGQSPTWAGNRHPFIAPYELFQTADGYINVAVGNETIWHRFCVAMGLGEIETDPRFATNANRVSHRDDLLAALEPHFRTRTTTDTLRLLEAADVPCGEVRSLAGVFADPQVAHLHLYEEIEHPVAGRLGQTGIPYRFSEMSGAIRRPPPTLGQHTAEILSELGYPADQITQLRAAGAI